MQATGPNPEKVGARRVGARWGPKHGARRVGGPKFSRFFPSPDAKFVLFFSLWVSSRGILVVLRAGTLKCARLEFSGCRVKPRRPQSSQETCTFEGPRLQKHHQNSTRRHPKGKNRTNFAAGEGKRKSEILGGPGEGRSRGKGGPGRGSTNCPPRAIHFKMHFDAAICPLAFIPAEPPNLFITCSLTTFVATTPPTRTSALSSPHQPKTQGKHADRLRVERECTAVGKFVDGKSSCSCHFTCDTSSDASKEQKVSVPPIPPARHLGMYLAASQS